jgi:uncharacterized protein YndB with AHSA1/START domain
MSASLRPNPYATRRDATTLTLQRLLPGTVERVWAYLTDGELRRRWLAAGAMNLTVGASFEFVWRNDEISSPGERPEGFGAEGRATCQITELEPLRKLGFSWPGVGEVTFELEPRGEEVLLTVIHRRVPDRTMALMVGPGWHMHLDILQALCEGTKPASFWSGWLRLRAEYEQRLPA